MKKIVTLALGMLMCVLVLQAQDSPYPPYSEMKGKVVISNFYSLDGVSEDNIFVNSLLWMIKNGNVSKEKSIGVDYDKKQIQVRLFLSGKDDTGIRYQYMFSASVKDNIITCLTSDIVYEADAAVIKFVKKLSFDKLQPEKKPKHKEYLDEFASLHKKWMQQLLDFIKTNQSPAITHWNEIKDKEVVKGMTETECLLSLGKPMSIQQNEGKTEWMYDAYTYLFFENGVLVSIIK